MIDEAVLYRVAGSQAVMRAQLHRLIEMSELPNLTVRVLQYRVGVLPSNNNKFIILNFAQPTVPGVVFVEGLTGDLYFDRAEDVEAYEEAFAFMRELAAPADLTRDIIWSVAAALGA